MEHFVKRLFELVAWITCLTACTFMTHMALLDLSELLPILATLTFKDTALLMLIVVSVGAGLRFGNELVPDFDKD